MWSAKRKDPADDLHAKLGAEEEIRLRHPLGRWRTHLCEKKWRFWVLGIIILVMMIARWYFSFGSGGAFLKLSLSYFFLIQAGSSL